MMDWSPFAMIASPALLFIYSGLTLYVALCLMLGFRAAHIYRKEDGRKLCCFFMPKWAVYSISGLGLSIMFAIIIIPAVCSIAFWVFVIEKIKRWFTCCRRGGDANDARSVYGSGGRNGDVESQITIDVPPSRPISSDDGKYSPNTQKDDCVVVPYLSKPGPVYIQSRTREDTLRG